MNDEQRDDLQPIVDLETIKAEQQVVIDRLERMEARRADVAEAVYLRVHADYQRQADELAARARPLQLLVRERHRVERERLAELEAACGSADLDRQEAEFRHELGEFDEADFRARVEAIEARLGETRRQREATDALIARIRAAFVDPSVLDQAAAPAQASAPAAASADPEPAAPVSAPSPEAPARPAASAEPELASTVIMPSLKIPPPAPAPPARPAAGASTTVLRTAQLVPQNPIAGLKPYVLGLRGAMIGSDPGCDVRIAGIGVAGEHARIRVSARGFTIEDLGAPAGTRVGGEKIQTHLLQDEDLVQIGAARLLFKDR